MQNNELHNSHPNSSSDHHNQNVVVSHHAVHTPPKTRPRKKRQEGWKSILTTVGILLAAPLLAIALTTYVFQTYQVDGPSMKETLQSGDRLIVWKAPRSWASLTGKTYIPNRGDIIVFEEPQYDKSFASKQLIKRVIGLPGERIVLDGSSITIYNDDYPEGFQPDLAPEGLPTEVDYSEDLVIPEGQIYVVGDNRGNSLDSRSFGPVPAENIIGKLTFRILPIDQAKKF